MQNNIEATSRHNNVEAAPCNNNVETISKNTNTEDVDKAIDKALKLKKYYIVCCVINAFVSAWDFKNTIQYPDDKISPVLAVLCLMTAIASASVALRYNKQYKTLQKQR